MSLYHWCSEWLVGMSAKTWNNSLKFTVSTSHDYLYYFRTLARIAKGNSRQISEDDEKVIWRILNAIESQSHKSDEERLSPLTMFTRGYLKTSIIQVFQFKDSFYVFDFFPFILSIFIWITPIRTYYVISRDRENI